MERRIGEKFTIKGRNLVVTKGTMGCAGCAFYDTDIDCAEEDIRDVLGSCTGNERDDHTPVIFSKVEESKNIGMNLKPFNIEEAKAGKSVCTRDGRKARILCFNLKSKTKKIVAAISSFDGKDEYVSTFDENGYHTSDGRECAHDLMMVPKKKQGWVNIFKSAVNKDRAVTSGYVYETEAIAISYITPDDKEDYIGTFQIEWEE